MTTDNNHNIPSDLHEQLRVAKLQYKKALNDAIHSRNLEKFTALVQQPGDFLNESEIILTLVKNDSYIEFFNVFLKQPHINLNIRDKYDMNPLARAINYNSNIIASKIIEQYGNDQNVINPKNSIWPPLHVACNNINVEMVDLLMKNGADSTLVSAMKNLTPWGCVNVEDFHSIRELPKINHILTLLKKPTGLISSKAAQDIPTASESDSTEDHFSFSNTVRSWGKKVIGWFTIHHPKHLPVEHEDTIPLMAQDADLNDVAYC